MTKVFKLILVLLLVVVWLVFAVGVLSWGYSKAYEIHYRQDIAAIDDLYVRFHSSLNEKRYEDAYACMSPDYRQATSMEQFRVVFATLGDEWLALESGRYISIDGDEASLYPRCTGWLDMWAGPLYSLCKIDGQWYFTGDYDWYYD